MACLSSQTSSPACGSPWKTCSSQAGQAWFCNRPWCRSHGAAVHRRPYQALSPYQSDGPVNNLGVLNAVVEQDSGPDAYSMQRVDPSSFANRGFYLDPASIGSSLLVLIVVLALSFQRILGLDRLVTSTIRSWQDKQETEKRDEVMAARQRLEQTWSSSDGDDEDKRGGK